MSSKNSISTLDVEERWRELHRERRKRWVMEEEEIYNRAIARIRQGTLSAISKQDMAVMPRVKFCAQCRSMFTHWSQWEKEEVIVPHHELIYQVITAARQGCGLCYMLMGMINADRDYVQLAELMLEQAPDKWEHGPHFQFLVRASRVNLKHADGCVLKFEPKQICAMEEPRYKNIKHTEIYLRLSDEPMGSLPLTDNANQDNIYQQLLPLPKRYETRSPVWEANISTVNSWLQECLNNHDCGSAPSSLPARLLAVKDDPIHIEGTLRLPVNTKYCTLSHCWGPNPDLTWQLKRANLELYHTSIPAQAFSKTFQDAIYIVRSLGIDYLWVDSLCIIQEDEEDFQREATRMSTIYGNSYLNIAATSASSGKEGCLISKPFLPILKTFIKLEDKYYQAYPAYLYDYGFFETPLSSRAWCYQERILASRTLHFSKAQLFWDCNSKFATECFPSGLPASITGGSDYSIEKKHLGSHWPEMVYEYTTCRLTDPHDKLVAFAGVVKRMEQQLHDKCYAGIWQNHIERNLLWCSFHPRKVQGYRAPSWSWAAIDGEINTPCLEDAGGQLFAHVLDICVMPCGNDPHGKLSGGVIKMRCQAIVDITTEVQEAFIEGAAYTNKMFLPVWEASICAYWDTTSLLHLNISTFYAVPIMKTSPWAGGSGLQGLIIVPKLDEKGVFQRIGTFAVLDRDEKHIAATFHSRKPEPVLSDLMTTSQYSSEGYIIKLI
jgi:hypothetical protein